MFCYICVLVGQGHGLPRHWAAVIPARAFLDILLVRLFPETRHFGQLGAFLPHNSQTASGPWPYGSCSFMANMLYGVAILYAAWTASKFALFGPSSNKELIILTSVFGGLWRYLPRLLVISCFATMRMPL